jgi:hypothetical protein|tara:strand:+ start:1728 stop:3458 length:1731 start_codon:yes stop_codon:yes gene_type:complete
MHSQKAVDAGEGSQPLQLGIESIVNSWIRNQMAYRTQLVGDLNKIATQVQEIRAPLQHITAEVFRRGIVWEPTTKKPDEHQLDEINKFIGDANRFHKTLEEVLRLVHFDLNAIDDAFILLNKTYVSRGKANPKLDSSIIEIRHLDPAITDFDLDARGLPENFHWFCPAHRFKVIEKDTPSDEEKKQLVCIEDDCGLPFQPAMYKYSHKNAIYYLLNSEVIHISKFYPTDTFGWSPILTLFEKALTLLGMDKNLYRYFFERKMPAAMLMVSTDDPDSLRRERQSWEAKTKQDSNFMPMVAVSSRNNRGRVDLVRLFHTMQEMDYLPIRNEIRERVASMWGVTPAWQGAPEGFGGLTTQTTQLVVMSRVVEGDQRIFHERVFPKILEAFNITDWKMVLPTPEEKAESTRISFALQRVQLAQQAVGLGYDIELKEQNVDLENVQFVVSGEAVNTAKLGAEQQALAIMQQEQQMQAEQQQAQGGEEQGGEQEMQLSMASKPWTKQLAEMGFPFPIIKELTPDGQRLWFTHGSEDFTASLNMGRIGNVNKAVMKSFTPPADATKTPNAPSKDIERIDDQED